jgi:molecular chaperone GrpE
MADAPKSDSEPSVRVVDRRWWARGETTDGDPAAPARKPTYVEELEQQAADRAAELQRVMAEHRRALDEFEQVKSRMRRDASREIERSKRAVIAELLEVLDNLDRAISSARSAGTSAAADSLLSGVDLVRQQFLAKLEAFGVRRVPRLGLKFDAAHDEAVSLAPVDSPDDDGVVVSVLKEAYAIGDEMLRPASVVVGRHDA